MFRRQSSTPGAMKLFHVKTPHTRRTHSGRRCDRTPGRERASGEGAEGHLLLWAACVDVNWRDTLALLRRVWPQYAMACSSTVYSQLGSSRSSVTEF